MEVYSHLNKILVLDLGSSRNVEERRAGGIGCLYFLGREESRDD